MSEYLNRLKQLRDAPLTDSFQSPNVHSNVSFRKAIDYIERLENEIKQLDDRYNELCDEMRVQGALNEMNGAG